MEVASIIGSFGRWQIQLFAFFFTCGMFSAWNSLSLTFFAPNVEYWCDGSDDLSSKCNTSEGTKCTKWNYKEGPANIIEEWNLVCDRSWLISASKSAYMVGTLTVVAISQVADRIGRRPVVLTGVTIEILAGILSAASPGIWVMIVSRYLLAIGNGARWGTGFVILLEIVGVNHRDKVGIGIEFGWALGYCVLPAMAYYIPNWRHLQSTCTMLELPFLPLAYFMVTESPRWLISQGRIDEAFAIIKKAGKINKIPDDVVQAKFKQLTIETQDECNFSTSHEQLSSQQDDSSSDGLVETRKETININILLVCQNQFIQWLIKQGKTKDAQSIIKKFGEINSLPDDVQSEFRKIENQSSSQVGDSSNSENNCEINLLQNLQTKFIHSLVLDGKSEEALSIIRKSAEVELIPEDEIEVELKKISKLVPKKLNVSTSSFNDKSNSTLGNSSSDQLNESKKNKNENTPKINILHVWADPTLRIQCLLLYLAWATNGFVYYGLTFNTNSLAGDPSLNFFLSGLVEVPAYILCLIILYYSGRKMSLVGTMIGAGICFLPIIVWPQFSSQFSMAGKFFITCSFAIIYLYSGEIFPTVARTVGLGSSSLFARVGAICAPFVKELGEHTSREVPLVIFGLLSFISAVLLFFFGRETRGVAMQDLLGVKYTKNEHEESRISSQSIKSNKQYGTN